MILSPFPIPPPPHRLPVFPTLPVFKMEDREEIRGREKLLPKWYFLDFILVSSETASITRSLSLETSTLLLWLDACSFLEHSTSQGGSRDPREFLRPFQGGCKVKTTFIMILRCAVPLSLSFSHECTVCFKEAIVCIHNYVRRLLGYCSLFQLVDICVRLNFFLLLQPKQH